MNPGQQLQVDVPAHPASSRSSVSSQPYSPSSSQSNAATRLQAKFRGNQGRQQAAAHVTPMTVAGQCAILRRELSVAIWSCAAWCSG